MPVDPSTRWCGWISFEPALEPLGESRVDHRSVQHVRRGVADRGGLGRPREPIDEVVVHRGVDDRGAERRAPLPGGAEPAEQRALDGQVEVGVGHHDERVLPAELQARRLQVASAQLADPGADRGRPREARPCGSSRPRSRRSSPANVEGPSASTMWNTPGRDAGVQDQLRERLGDRGRVLRRLPHHGVAAQQRRHDVPGGHGDREVPRGDDRGGSDRRAEREQLLVGQLARHRHPVETPTLRLEEGAGVDDLLHLAARFGDRLADLAGDQRGQRLLVRPDELAEVLDHLAAHGSGHGRPARPAPRRRRARRARTCPRRRAAPRTRGRPGWPGSGSDVGHPAHPRRAGRSAASSRCACRDGTARPAGKVAA